MLARVWDCYRPWCRHEHCQGSYQHLSQCSAHIKYAAPCKNNQTSIVFYQRDLILLHVTVNLCHVDSCCQVGYLSASHLCHYCVYFLYQNNDVHLKCFALLCLYAPSLTTSVSNHLTPFSCHPLLQTEACRAGTRTDRSSTCRIVEEPSTDS